MGNIQIHPLSGPRVQGLSPYLCGKQESGQGKQEKKMQARHLLVGRLDSVLLALLLCGPSLQCILLTLWKPLISCKEAAVLEIAQPQKLPRGITSVPCHSRKSVQSAAEAAVQAPTRSRVPARPSVCLLPEPHRRSLCWRCHVDTEALLLLPSVF